MPNGDGQFYMRPLGYRARKFLMFSTWIRLELAFGPLVGGFIGEA
jgi:hypothetical protein